MHADLFAAEDGSFHALVGLLTGKDSAKQPLALYCLANLAAAAARPLQLARAAGPYLITHLTDAAAHPGGGVGGRGAAELACTVLANLAMTGDRQAVRVLVNQEVVATLVGLVASGTDEADSSSSLEEVAYQALYHIIILAELEADTINSLTKLSLGK